MISLLKLGGIYILSGRQLVGICGASVQAISLSLSQEIAPTKQERGNMCSSPCSLGSAKYRYDKGVCVGVLGTQPIIECEIESDKEQSPAGLARVQAFSCLYVL